MMTKTVAVDFDGVIHAYRRGWHDGTIYDDPIPGAIDALAELQADYAVFVHTSRNPVLVAEWLDRHGTDAVCEADVANAPGEIQFWDRQDLVLVTDRKLPAIAYIDDRGIRFVSWRQALVALSDVQRAAVALNPGLDLKNMSADEHSYRAAGGIG